MKYLIVIVITTFCIYSCKNKETERIQEGIDYVLDSSMQLMYQNVTPFSEMGLEKEQKYELDLKGAFSFAKSDIETMGLELFLPLQICLFNDSVWIIQNGKPTLKDNEVHFGDDVYFEIRKSDGFVLKRIIGE